MASSFVNAQTISRMGAIAINNLTPYTKSLVNGYGDQLGKATAFGDSLAIRKSANPLIRNSITFDSTKNFQEQKVDLKIDQPYGVDVTFSAKERTFDIDNMGKRVVVPYIANLSAGIEAANMAATINKVSNVITASALTKRQIIDAKAQLNANGAGFDRRRLQMVMNPLDEAKFVNDTSVIYNNGSKISKQYDTGDLGDLYGFSTFASNLIPQLKTGSISRTAGAITVNADVAALTDKDATYSTVVLKSVVAGDTIFAGEILTFEKTYQVNYQNKDLIEKNLFSVVVLEDATAAALATTMSVKVTPMFAASTGDLSPWKNVNVLPVATDKVVLLGAASSSYNQSFCYHPEYATIKFVNYEVGGSNLTSKSYMQDGMAITFTEEGSFNSLSTQGRFDAFLGRAVIRDKMATRIIEI